MGVAAGIAKIPAQRSLHPRGGVHHPQRPGPEPTAPPPARARTECPPYPRIPPSCGWSSPTAPCGRRTTFAKRPHCPPLHTQETARNPTAGRATGPPRTAPLRAKSHWERDTAGRPPDTPADARRGKTEADSRATTPATALL